MNEEHANLKLPLPKWCFVVLAVPTFYMPLAYMTMAVCVIGQLLLGLPGQSFPEWVAYVVGAALYITFAMWADLHHLGCMVQTTHVARKGLLAAHRVCVEHVRNARVLHLYDSTVSWHRGANGTVGRGGFEFIPQKVRC